MLTNKLVFGVATQWTVCAFNLVILIFAKGIYLILSKLGVFDDGVITR